jgi:hypothetical protein
MNRMGDLSSSLFCVRVIAWQQLLKVCECFQIPANVYLSEGFSTLNSLSLILSVVNQLFYLWLLCAPNRCVEIIFAAREFPKQPRFNYQ